MFVLGGLVFIFVMGGAFGGYVLMQKSAKFEKMQRMHEAQKRIDRIADLDSETKKIEMTPHKIPKSK